MSGFKVGAKVVSIQEDLIHLYIKKGSTYTVSKVRPSGCIELEEIAASQSYSQQNFELASKVNKFKVGDTVRCINDEGYPITQGEVYTVEEVAGEFLRVIDDGVSIGGYRYTRFELVQEPVLTPEEVLKHLLAGTKMEYKLDSKWVSHSGDLNLLSVQSLSSLQWRIKPVPEIIEANGRKYKLIEE